MATLIDFYSQWINEIPQGGVIFLIFPKVQDPSLIRTLFDITLQSNNVATILFSGPKIPLPNDNRIEEYNLKSEAKLTNPSYIFIDFTKNNGNELFPSAFLGIVPQTDEKKDLTYFFKKPVWRKNVHSLFIYNFSGTRPVNDFWIADDYHYADFFRCDRSKWAELSQDVSVNINNEMSEQWRIGLKNYLRTILKYIVEANFVDLFVQEKYFSIWTRAFVHKSYNILYNYDPIEYYGDAVSKFCFRKYMIQKYPRFVQRELTEYSNQYMSEVYQHIFSDDLSLISWLIYNPVITSTLLNNTKTKTDVLESFSGALAEIGDLISPGIGTIACQNFYTILGESLSFPKSMAYGIHITQIGQINEKLGFSKITEPFKKDPSVTEENENNNRFIESHSGKEKAFILKRKDVNFTNENGGVNKIKRTTIEFNPHFLAFLNSNGINTEIITQKFNSKWSYDQNFTDTNRITKKEAEEDIYSQIYYTYMLAGITQDFSSQYKKDIFDGIEINLVVALKNKVGETNFKKIDFYTDQALGVVIMYLDIYPSSAPYSGRDTLSYEIEDVNIDAILPENLAVVPFVTSVPERFRGIKNNIVYSKENAINSYLTTV